jgi:uncharacterized membrane protein
MLLDVVMDPMTLRGSHWFLGTLYRYRAGGPWFGVPWSNFGGWILVSALIVALDGLAMRAEPSAETARRGRLIAYATCACFVMLAVATRLWLIALGAIGASAVILLARVVALRRAPAPNVVRVWP